MLSKTPNAKTCPRCGSVVPAQQGVCATCGRLFRTPFAQTLPENRTMMFHDGAFSTAALPPPAALPRILRVRRWLQRMRTGAQHLLIFFSAPRRGGP
jgi:ribosomal protein S27AE